MKQILIIGTGGAGCNVIHDLQTARQENCSLPKSDFTFDKATINSPDIHFCGVGYDTENSRQEPWFIPAGQDLSTMLPDVLNGIETVFIVCGTHGKTGGSLAKEIEQYTASKNIPTVLVAIYPFFFEGEGNTQQTIQYFESRSLDIIRLRNGDNVDMDLTVKEAFFYISLQIFQAILSYLGEE